MSQTESVLVDWEHSNVGPSAAERWLECPGSVLWTKDMPDTSGEDAIQGTAAHMVTEWCRKQEVVAETFLGKAVKIEDRNIEITQEMCDAVNTFCEFVEQFPGEALIEERVSYTAWVPGGFGTSDDMRIADGTCVVSDFKYGKGIQVFAPDNPQLKLYALGIFHDFGYLYDIEKFRLNIVQPRLDHIDSWEITVEELLEWANTVVTPAAKVALAPDAPFKAGEWCRFCRGKNVCETRARTIYEEAIGDFDDLTAETPVEHIDVNTLTLDKIGLLLPFLPEMKAFAESMERHALSEIAKGNVIVHPVTGEYKIVEGRSNRAWKHIAAEGQDEDEAIAKKLKGAKLKVNDIFIRKLKGPAAIEKILGKKHPLMIELVEKPKGKPKLAPGTDKRPAITVNPEDEFDPVEETEE